MNSPTEIDMQELYSYLVAQSVNSSYNMNMNTDTTNIILTLFLLLPTIMIPIVLFYDLVTSYRQEQKELFGSVHPDEQ